MKKILKKLFGAERAARHAPAWTRVAAGPLAGCEFLLPKGLKGWSGAIVQGVYEPELFAALSELAQGGGGLYDIGAHVGYVATAWLKLGGARANCFEPVPGNANVVEETLQRNGFATQSRVHRLALGDSNGACTLMVNAQHLGKTSMAYVREVGGIDRQEGGKVYAKAMEVPAQLRTLDSFVAEQKLPPPRVLKIDVEGAEAKVLQGARETIERHRPALLLELHNIDAAVYCAEPLVRLGYRSKLLFKAEATCAFRWDP
ncbi:MAG: FkbM family methyltransferase [Planctomycetes bacterium]|nr:FkbM family methyltransferase [Planctomycetota bacterium]